MPPAEEEASVPPPPELPAASPCSSSEDSSHTSQTSTSTSSATEAALRVVSEGELLSNVQLEDTMTGEALCTFSLQDMGFDPPSEGQAGGQDLLLANLEDSITVGEQECVSVGEVGGEQAAITPVSRQATPDLSVCVDATITADS